MKKTMKPTIRIDIHQIKDVEPVLDILDRAITANARIVNGFATLSCSDSTFQSWSITMTRIVWMQYIEPHIQTLNLTRDTLIETDNIAVYYYR